jgi:predicted ATPase
MKIRKCQIKNFTVFQEQEIAFCTGVNVFIGTNGTGKSHLLKILYAMTQTMTRGPSQEKGKSGYLHFLHLLNGLFKPEGGDTGLLMRNLASDAIAEFGINDGFGMQTTGLFAGRKVQGYDPATIAQSPNAPGVFIPPSDVLALYPGFTASYEKRELAFDQTYYDICKALSAAPLKAKNAALSRLKLSLEDLLQGTVIQKGDRFYVQNKASERTLEAHLLAEGHRKIAALVHLINNGAIDKNTILFWDEPETNMNPRLISRIALFLRELVKAGVQVFLTTHDYLLTGELSLAAEYGTAPKVPIRFFAMSREGDGPVTVQSGDTLADLHDNAILDEFAEHYRREQDAIVQQLKTGNSE